jgi:hypothetical protein
MSTRISSAGALLLLAACSQAATEDAAIAADADAMIECALAGVADFARLCAVERTQAEGAPILVVRHPDGGFRRFEVMSNGSGVATADGAQPAAVTPRDDGIEVAVGTDRYRLPTTIVGDVAR